MPPEGTMKRIILGAVAAVALFGAGYWTGQAQQAEQARATTGLYADICYYRTSTEWTTTGGSYTRLEAIVADIYRGQLSSVTSRSARSAVNSFDCEREW
jgi:hypothetical protein